jgi:transposase
MSTKVTRSYTKEFKQEAIRLALNSPSIAGAARDIGIPSPTLHNWVYKAKRNGEVPSPTSSGTINVGDVIKENQELRKRLARLEQEKAILKKAAAYFAKELE